MKIVCSGHLVRYPLGGHSWHHLQYLLGFQRLGNEVTFFEDWGWSNSCYDPARGVMTGDPSYGLVYLRALLRPHDLDARWCYLAENGTAHGMSRAALEQACRECDLYVNLSGINWIPELEQCRRRVLVDTDPVFTQIGAHGLAGPFGRYHVRFTYGENVHRPGCTMPTGDVRWQPTRQPIVVELWPFEPGDPNAPLATVMNWTGYGEHRHGDRVYGTKAREFEPFFALPREIGDPMELAVSGAPAPVRERLVDGGWRLADPLEVTRTPRLYQHYLRSCRGEFSVAKHGYVVTRSGWFSDRSAGYLASGRPVVVQDTGFSDFLPTGKGLLAFTTREEAVASIRQLGEDYEGQCRAARALVEEHFDAARVLTDLLERALETAA